MDDGWDACFAKGLEEVAGFLAESSEELPVCWCVDDFLYVCVDDWFLSHSSSCQALQFPRSILGISGFLEL